ncbi:hypothetical protein V6N13_005922 [Hibiscus sabdariffa]
MHMITPGRAVAPGYMEWFYANGKLFIMTPEARARAGGPSTSAVPGFAAQGPSTEPYTPMPPVFTHGASSQFQSPMAPPTEGFFVGAFQPYSSMMTTPHQLHTPVAPLSVYPPHRPDFGSSYGMVQHTPPGSLFATGPSGSGHDVHDDVEADRSEEDENDEDALVRRNPRRNRRAPDCGTGGHRRH